MVADKRGISARRRKLKNAFDKFDALFGDVGEGSSSHKPDNYGSHLDDLLIAQEEARRAKFRQDMELESVIFFIENKGLGFQSAECKWCGSTFTHTYIGVGYCSERCRAAKLNELGIEYNINGKMDHERWNCKGKGWMPKIIGTYALEAIKTLELDCTEEADTDPTLPSPREVEPDNSQDIEANVPYQ